MSVLHSNRSREAAAGKLRAATGGFVKKLMLSMAAAGLAAFAVAAPASADGPLGGLLGGDDEGLLGGVTGAVDDLVGGTLGGGGGVTDGVPLIGDADGLTGGLPLVGGGGLADGIIGANDGLLTGLLGQGTDLSALTGTDVLAGLLDDNGEGTDDVVALVEVLASGVAGPEGLRLAEEIDLCLANCPDYRLLGLQALTSHELAPGILPQAHAGICIPGPCSGDERQQLLAADLRAAGSDLLGDTTVETCAAGDCWTDGLTGNGLALARVATSDHTLVPELTTDACVVAVCEGYDYTADGVLGGTLLVEPNSTALGSDLLGELGAEACVLATCEDAERYRSGVLTLNLMSEDETLLPGVDGVVCALAVCSEADPSDDPSNDPSDNPDGDPSGDPDGDPDGGQDGPSVQTTDGPPLVLMPPTNATTQAPSGLVSTIGVGLPNAGVAPAGDSGSAADGWRFAVAAAGLLVVAGGWFAGRRVIAGSR